MKAITIPMVLLAATLAGAGENDAVTFTRDVHHLRTVILEMSEEDDGYKGQLTSMQNRMTDADEVKFDGEMLTITGLWRIDKIEILSIDPWERRRR